MYHLRQLSWPLPCGLRAAPPVVPRHLLGAGTHTIFGVRRHVNRVPEEPASIVIAGIFSRHSPKRGERYDPADALPILENPRGFYTHEYRKILRDRLARIQCPILITFTRQNHLILEARMRDAQPVKNPRESRAKSKTGFLHTTGWRRHYGLDLERTSRPAGSMTQKSSGYGQ